MPVMPTAEASIPLGWEVEVHEPQGGGSHGYYTVETLVHNILEFTPGVVDYLDFKVSCMFPPLFCLSFFTKRIKGNDLMLVLLVSHITYQLQHQHDDMAPIPRFLMVFTARVWCPPKDIPSRTSQRTGSSPLALR